MVSYYKELLGYKDCSFLDSYLNDSMLLRLKGIGYFCGMDYASKNIYDFSEYISRYDHSITVALIVNRLTNDKIMTLAGLYHDIASPCFSHVIDYMNKDYLKQESTEEYTEKLLKKDDYLIDLLKKDNINLNDIIEFKRYSIVDNNRPLVCADRIDGVVLNSIGWLKNISKEDIKNIVNALTLYKNEYNEDEIGFNNYDIALLFQTLNDKINAQMHTKEDIYMMELLARIVKLSISRGVIVYDDLYRFSEKSLLDYIKTKADSKTASLLFQFETICSKDIKNSNIMVKNRCVNPLYKGKRII